MVLQQLEHQTIQDHFLTLGGASSPSQGSNVIDYVTTSTLGNAADFGI